MAKLFWIGLQIPSSIRQILFFFALAIITGEPVKIERRDNALEHWTKTGSDIYDLID
jgi:hypothetical protein